MTPKTRDLRILATRPLTTPDALQAELPLPAAAAQLVADARRQIEAVLKRRDDRLIVVVGPCSIHDPDAAVEYGRKLVRAARRWSDDLLIVMRVYFEKPRTVTGWKGLINDPHLDGSFEINEGLRCARHLLLDLAALGLPTATEFLDTVIGQYFAELISWGCIGARTIESQVHRELASGLSMPVGFKNGTDGSLEAAIDAMRAAREPHWFPTLLPDGQPAILGTRGNRATHLVLRGGTRSGPNFASPAVQEARQRLRARKLPQNVMIDCSHGNSGKEPRRQPAVARIVAEQIATGTHGIIGTMLESNLVAGRQDVISGRKLVRGQSITDACLGWKETLPVLKTLATAVRARREAGK